MTVREFSVKFVKLYRSATSLVCNNRDKMRRFPIRINENLEKECRFAKLDDNMDLLRLMVHVQQVQNSRKNRGVRDATRSKAQDMAGPSHGGHKKRFGIHEQPKFKKGKQSLGNSNSHRTTTSRGGRPEHRKGNGGEIQHHITNCC